MNLLLARRVVRFDGRPLSRDECLEPVIRWTARSKGRVCEGVSAGLVSIAEITEAHGITPDELTRWLILYRTGGLEALRERSIPENRRAAA